MKKFTIELNEKQLLLIEKATDFHSRTLCGQLYLGYLEDILMQAWQKNHPTMKWTDIRDECDKDMIMLQKKYFELSRSSYYGIGHDDTADDLWDIHKCCEHARYLAMSKEDQEKLRWTVMADEPVAFGKEGLIKIEEIKK